MSTAPPNTFPGPHARRLATGLLALHLASCEGGGDGPSLSKPRPGAELVLRVGERVPAAAEASVVGALESRVMRSTPAFTTLVSCAAPELAFKNEERTGADRMMTPRLCNSLRRLGARVGKEWPGLRLRVTEAWDERREHAASSVHYEGRAADLTTSDVDPEKLGRLGRLAVEAGLDWVYFEDRTHVHVSVRR